MVWLWPLLEGWKLGRHNGWLTTGQREQHATAATHLQDPGTLPCRATFHPPSTAHPTSPQSLALFPTAHRDRRQHGQDSQGRGLDV